MLDYFKKFFSFDMPPIDRRTYNDLNKLTDRELNDIGISRSQIAMVARGIDPQKGWAK